jgi:DNA invertase Pin-like site-specific DNA recombinase
LQLRLHRRRRIEAARFQRARHQRHAGEHVAGGALGHLLVESLDRISRAEVDEALDLFLKIIRRGIILVTLQDGQVFSKEKIKEDRGISLIISITVMIRAHDESATKQERIKQSWANRGANAAKTPALDGRTAYDVDPSWMKARNDETMKMAKNIAGKNLGVLKMIG